MRRLLGRAVPVSLWLIVAVACAVAALLAFARLDQHVRGREIELVSFTPLGLPLALVALLAAGLLALRHSRVAPLVMVACLALACLHAWWLAPLFVGAVPDAAPGDRLVVMTQNLEYGDADQVVAIVEEHEVDVLVLTDSPPGQVEAVQRAGLGIVLPHTTLRDGNGSVIWSRYPITSSTFISDGGESRLVTLDVPEFGELDVVALHPTPPYQENGEKWLEDWSRILDFFSDRYGASVNGNVLAVGDFNATLDHPPLRVLAERGLRDSAEQLNRGWSPTWPANGLERRAGRPIPTLLTLDHVLTSETLAPTELVVTGAAESDHRAVIVTLAPGR